MVLTRIATVSIHCVPKIMIMIAMDHGNEGDCNDANPVVYPGADESRMAQTMTVME